MDRSWLPQCPGIALAMIGMGFLFLCLLVGLRVTWLALRHRGITAFVLLIGVVAIASFARADRPDTSRNSVKDPAYPKSVRSACQVPETAHIACSALLETAGLNATERAWAYINRGVAAAAAGDMLSAISDYSKAIELTPEDPVAWSNRGTAHAALGDLLPALADHEKALTLAPDNASAWHNRAVDFEELGQHKNALSDYAMAIQLNPRHVGSHIGIATANCKLGRVKASAAARLALIDKGLMPAITLQQILKDEGFYSGKLDGVFGKGSRAALRAWTRKGCLAHA